MSVSSTWCTEPAPIFLVPVIVGGRRVETGYYYYLAFVGLAFLLVGIFALLRGSDSSSRRFFVLAIGVLLALHAVCYDTRC